MQVQVLNYSVLVKMLQVENSYNGLYGILTDFFVVCVRVTLTTFIALTALCMILCKSVLLSSWSSSWQMCDIVSVNNKFDNIIFY